MEDLGVDTNIILEFILRKPDRRVLTGSVCLRIGARCGLLWTQ